MPLSKEDIAYLRAAAARDGYSADDAMKVFGHESSLDPTVWGGKGGQYFGLFQAGPSERKDYGVDVVHPSARNQIDAFGRFLHGRGYKPGMGLEDMYSTVLAGRPGLYNRTDGAGTVAQHVARMQGGSAPGMTLSGSPEMSALAYADSASPPSADAPKADPIAELLNMQTPMRKPDPISSLLADEPKQEDEQARRDAFRRQIMDFHNAQHMRAIQGLL
jgi:hypothetical protein